MRRRTLTLKKPKKAKRADIKVGGLKPSTTLFGLVGRLTEGNSRCK